MTTDHRLPAYVAVAAVLLLSSVVLLPGSVAASGLLAPSIGPADDATGGTRIADPPTPSAALFSNPAGLTRFPTTTVSGSMGLGWGRMEIESSRPAGYEDTNEIFLGIPDFGASVPLGDRTHVGFGFYGTTGSTFEFEGDPTRGLDDFFSETILVAAPLAVAYRVSDTLSVGAQVEPLFGQLRTRFSLPGLRFRYKLNGFGVQGTVGASLRPSERWAVGLAVRTPGMIWMDGSMPVPGAGRQDIDVDLEMPTQVFLGTTWQATRCLTLSGSVRFTDASSLGDSTIEYELTPQANVGFVPDGKDEWRFALGAEQALADGWALRGGASYASRIVGSHGVSPLVFDGEDVKLTIGVGKEIGAFTIDAVAGWAFPFERRISPESALVLPGTYRGMGAILALGLTYRFPAGVGD